MIFPKSEDVAGWYDLLRRIVADLRGVNLEAREGKKRRYGTLMLAIQRIHEDYVGMFVDFENDLPMGADPAAVEAARSRFLDRRRVLAKERVLTVLDARALRDLASDPEEQAYLEAVGDYVSASRDLAAAFPSLSRAFWEDIATLDDAVALRRLTTAALRTIEARHRAIIQSYAALDPGFAFDSRGKTLES